jgi:ATP-dependent Lon protease
MLISITVKISITANTPTRRSLQTRLDTYKRIQPNDEAIVTILHKYTTPKGLKELQREASKLSAIKREATSPYYLRL